MYWYPFTTKEAMLLLLVFMMSGVFSYLQQYFVPPSLIPYTYVLFLLLLLLAYFPVVRPADPLALARFLSVLLGVIYAAMILLREFVIRQNYSPGSVVIIAGAIIAPLVAGWLYHLAANR
ncbi:hypothetical protein [Methanoregula sp.]|uniref:hypothetical protein n=1 Tax=Methanoregula sp. TaxID=2052170 RepID=UPI00236E7F28|nr:hypothetical protein [Methanoregula sp.]MDD1686994.1 hypothetical protein [Methanoregula sp.]